jgi:hypothetical protein
MTFVARNRQGQFGPAYARYIAIPGNNFISNAWRADSEATVGNASLGAGAGVSWPDEQQCLPGVLARRPPAVFASIIGTKVLPTTKNLPSRLAPNI